jgi:lysyl-tRNA synthetase class 2
VPSTVIRDYDYDPLGRELRISLVTGRVYVYLNVPQEVYESFSTAFSKGRFYNKHIRNAYEFREITHAD